MRGILPVAACQGRRARVETVRVIREFEAVRREELVVLFRSGWWTETRDRAAVDRLIEGSDAVVGLIDLASDRLVGFARSITDRVFLAVVLDVIVDPSHRATGLGACLMDELLAAEAVKSVESIELVCQPELIAFYERWGFTNRVGRSVLMRRSENPLLVGEPPREP
jgi:GNAT superfamily N-acetyltransferase